MNTVRINSKILAIALISIAALSFFVTPAFADHGDEPEVTTHAQTVHEDEEDDVVVGPTMTLVTASSDVVRMQKLVVVLQQLVDLLKKKAELAHNATPHEHEENEEHTDEHNDEDHD